MAKYSSFSVRNLSLSLVLLTGLLLAACGSAEDRAQGHYNRGKQLIAQKDYVRGSIELRNAVRLNRKHVSAWRELADIEERNRNWGGLNATLRTIIELDPKDVRARLALGKLLLLANQIDQALEQANAAGDVDARNPDVMSFKAAVLLRLNDNAGAIREAKSALEVNPAHIEATLVLAAERRLRGDLKGALELLDAEPIGDIANISVQLLKLSILGQMQNGAAVEALLKKLAEHYPDQQSAFRQQLVRLYLSQRRVEEAEKELRTIANSNPASADARLDVVRFLGAINGAAAAEKELQELIGAGGQTLRYQMALVDLKLAQNDPAGAIKLLQQLIAASKAAEEVLAARTKLAEVYIARKQYDDAEKIIAEILRADSRNTNGLRLRAAVHIERGRLENAIADLRQALNDQPRSTDLMLLLAMAYERSGSIELAERQFADAARTSNFDPAVSMNYVTFLRRRGNVSHAEEVLTELATRHRTNIVVLSALADVRLQRQNFVGAQQVADMIRKVGDNWGFVADQILGASLSGQKRFEESVTAVESAYNAAIPGAIQPMAALATAYVRAKQIDRAFAMVRSVLKENPKNAEAHVLLGSLHLIQNAQDEALRSFKAAIENGPDNAVGYRALADFYLRTRRVDDALSIVQDGLKHSPGNTALRLVLAGILEAKGEFEAAIAEYEVLVKAQPGSMVFTNNLASLLADHRNDRESLDRALALASSLRRSQVPHFLDTLGWVYFRQGNFKAAVPLLEQAAAQMPNVALVRYHLGRGFAAIEEPAKAVVELKRALELAASDEDLARKIRAALEQLPS